MSKYFKVIFTHTETVTTEATAEGDTPEEVVDKIRNYFAGTVDNLTIQSIEELDTPPSSDPKGKPNLRIVN